MSNRITRRAFVSELTVAGGALAVFAQDKGKSKEEKKKEAEQKKKDEAAKKKAEGGG